MRQLEAIDRIDSRNEQQYEMTTHNNSNTVVDNGAIHELNAQLIVREVRIE